MAGAGGYIHVATDAQSQSDECGKMIIGSESRSLATLDDDDDEEYLLHFECYRISSTLKKKTIRPLLLFRPRHGQQNTYYY